MIPRFPIMEHATKAAARKRTTPSGVGPPSGDALQAGVESPVGLPRFLHHAATGTAAAPAGPAAVDTKLRDAGADDLSGVPLPATTTPTADAAVCPKPLPTFPKSTTYGYAASRFDAKYTPTGPDPRVDDLAITHRIHVEFLPFSTRLIKDKPRLFGKYKGVKFTPAQRAEFAWKKTQQEAFQKDFQTNVSAGWSGKHMLKTIEPCFASYQARPMVHIEFVDDVARAHTAITAYKMPSDTTRLRSEVRGSSSAILESRDPTVETKNWVMPSDWVRQVGPFDFDKADANSDVQKGVDEVAGLLRPHLDASQPDDPFGPDSCLALQGRASSEGSVAYNEALARRRVVTVRDKIREKLGLPPPRVWLWVGKEPGERNVTTEAKFRRVDVSFSAKCPVGADVPQNVAAHEFGHMLGFGDEYVDEKPPKDVLPKFEGDKPTHYGDVEAALGTDAANDLLVQNSGSIMSEGNDVHRGHYIYFLQAMNAMTGKSWTVE